MEKSEIYKYTQVAILKSDFNPSTKLEILRELMFREGMERATEKYKEAQNATV